MNNRHPWEIKNEIFTIEWETFGTPAEAEAAKLNQLKAELKEAEANAPEAAAF